MPLWQCGSLAFWHCYYRFLLTLGSCKTLILRLYDKETCKWTCDWPWPWRNVCRACVMQPVCHPRSDGGKKRCVACRCRHCAPGRRRCRGCFQPQIRTDRLSSELRRPCRICRSSVAALRGDRHTHTCRGHEHSYPFSCDIPGHLVRPFPDSGHAVVITFFQVNYTTHYGKGQQFIFARAAYKKSC